MSLTLSPARTQLRYPDDFPNGRCQFGLISEYPDPGPGAPLLRVAVRKGPYLITTDAVSTPKASHEFGHKRELGIRRFVVQITIMPDFEPQNPPTSQTGELLLENGTDRVLLPITTAPTVEPDRITLSFSKPRLAFGNVAPMQVKTETLLITSSFSGTAGSPNPNRTVPVRAMVEPTGVFAISIDNTAFADSVTIPVGTAPVKLLVRFKPQLEGTHNASLTLSASGIDNQVVPLWGTARTVKRPLWPFFALGALLLVALLWTTLQKPKNSDNLKITGVSATEIQLSYPLAGTTRNIERSTDGTVFEKITVLSEGNSNYTDTGLHPATRYWYRGRINGRIIDSAPTATVDTTTLGIVPPRPIPTPPSDTTQPPPVSTTLAAPQNLRASLNHRTVQLRWRDMATNEQGYELERSRDGVSFTRIKELPSNTDSATDQIQSTTGARYYYRVRALNDSNRSAYSNVEKVVVPPPFQLPRRHPREAPPREVPFQLPR